MAEPELVIAVGGVAQLPMADVAAKAGKAAAKRVAAAALKNIFFIVYFWLFFESTFRSIGIISCSCSLRQNFFVDRLKLAVN